MENKLELNDKVLFNLEDVGFEDLDGNFIKLTFDQKLLGNALFTIAETIEMDDFARNIYKEGKAETSKNVIGILLIVVESLQYTHRAKTAFKDYLNKLLTQNTN